MRVVLLLLALLMAACFQAVGPQINPAATPAQSPMDTAVARVHATMMRAMGGEDGWQRARYFEFDFVPVRQGSPTARWSHRWDRWTGDYRLSGVRGGDTIIALFNTNKPKEGRVTVNGQVPPEVRRDSLLTYGYARFINDTYWLIMPYKWRDAGVMLTSEGRQTDEKGRVHDVVKLTFADVGLTPQNQYLAFVNAETGLMERWYHYPRAGAEPARYDWSGWQQFGPIRLATEKPALDANSMIRFENVRVLTATPARAFDR